MQAQTNLHDKKLDDLAEKMDKLIEVLGNLQTQKHQTEGRIYQEKEDQSAAYQKSPQLGRNSWEEAYQRKQEANQEYLRSWDNLLEIMQELAQEEERNEQVKKAEEKIQEQEQNSFETVESSNPLGGIDDQTAESIGDFNPNDVHNDEFLDLSREIESMEFKNVLLISEKVEIKEEIKKLKMEQEFVTIFSNSYGLYCNANDTFDRKLKRKWVAGVFYIWGGGWCFDPGKKLIFLEEIPSYLNQHNDCKAGASDLSKNLESMELEKLQLKDACKENEICQGQFCFLDARPMGFVSEQRSWILWEGISRISKVEIIGTDNDSSKLFDPGKNLSFLEDAMFEKKKRIEGSMRCGDYFNSEEHN